MKMQETTMRFAVLASLAIIAAIALAAAVSGCEISTTTRIKEYQTSKGYQARCTDLGVATRAYERLPAGARLATRPPQARDLDPVDGQPDDVCNEDLW